MKLFYILMMGLLLSVTVFAMDRFWIEFEQPLNLAPPLQTNNKVFHEQIKRLEKDFTSIEKYELDLLSSDDGKESVEKINFNPPNEWRKVLSHLGQGKKDLNSWFGIEKKKSIKQKDQSLPLKKITKKKPKRRCEIIYIASSDEDWEDFKSDLKLHPRIAKKVLSPSKKGWERYSFEWVSEEEYTSASEGEDEWGEDWEEDLDEYISEDISERDEMSKSDPSITEFYWIKTQNNRWKFDS